mmetsp:Transcript_5085/g.9573  ORF Transcript_5085/g.9573 Transcript_5085/m.9573 type:complete len:353 (+) Transcript_5085:1-1059(+)
MSPDYEKGFHKAKLAFRHHIVFKFKDPIGGVEPLCPVVPKNLELLAEHDRDLAFAGAHLPREVANLIAKGQLNPISHEPYSVPYGIKDKSTLNSGAAVGRPSPALMNFFKSPSKHIPEEPQEPTIPSKHFFARQVKKEIVETWDERTQGESMTTSSVVTCSTFSMSSSQKRKKNSAKEERLRRLTSTNSKLSLFGFCADSTVCIRGGTSNKNILVDHTTRNTGVQPAPALDSKEVDNLKQVLHAREEEPQEVVIVEQENINTQNFKTPTKTVVKHHTETLKRARTEPRAEPRVALAPCSPRRAQSERGQKRTKPAFSLGSKFVTTPRKNPFMSFSLDNKDIGLDASPQAKRS